MGMFNLTVLIRNEKQLTKEAFIESFCRSMEECGYKRSMTENGSCYELVFAENMGWVALERKAYGGNMRYASDDACWFSENMQTACIELIKDRVDTAMHFYNRPMSMHDFAVLGADDSWSDPSTGERRCWEPLLKVGVTWDQFKAVMEGKYASGKEGLEKWTPLLDIDCGCLGLGAKKAERVALYFRKAERSPSLTAEFKRVYAEKLAPYGFRQIKGRHPYVARVLGDEILQVVSCVKSGTSFWPRKSFEVVWGVATVYRPKINLEVSPMDTNWIRRNTVRSDSGDTSFEYLDRKEAKSDYFFEDGSDNSEMLDQLERSANALIRRELPKMDQFKTLQDYMHKKLYIDVNDLDFYHEDEEDEGILNYTRFTFDEYEAKWQRICERATSDLKEKMERRRKEEVAAFRKFAEDETYHRKVMEEIERRKESNQEILRGYGFEI